MISHFLPGLRKESVKGKTKREKWESGEWGGVCVRVGWEVLTNTEKEKES